MRAMRKLDTIERIHDFDICIDSSINALTRETMGVSRFIKDTEILIPLPPYDKNKEVTYFQLPKNAWEKLSA